MALCRITGTVYLPNGQPAASQEIQFYKADTKIKADYLGAVLPDVVTVMTSPTGVIAVDLLTGYYKMYSKTDTITAFGKVTVPDALTAIISDILEFSEIPEQNPTWLQQALQAREEALDAAELSENAAIAAQPIQSRSIAEQTTVPSGVTHINVNGLTFKRDATGTALSTVDGNWSPVGDITPFHFGEGQLGWQVEINKAIEYAYASGNRQVVIDGGYRKSITVSNSIIPMNGVTVQGINNPEIVTTTSNFLSLTGITGFNFIGFKINGPYSGTSYIIKLNEGTTFCEIDVELENCNSGIQVVNTKYNTISLVGKSMRGTGLSLTGAGTSGNHVKKCIVENCSLFGMYLASGASNNIIDYVHKYVNLDTLREEQKTGTQWEVETGRLGLEGLGITPGCNYNIIGTVISKSTHDNGASVSGDYNVINDMYAENCAHEGLHFYGSYNSCGFLFAKSNRMSGAGAGGGETVGLGSYNTILNGVAITNGYNAARFSANSNNNDFRLRGIDNTLGEYLNQGGTGNKFNAYPNGLDNSMQTLTTNGAELTQTVVGSAQIPSINQVKVGTGGGDVGAGTTLSNWSISGMIGGVVRVASSITSLATSIANNIIRSKIRFNVTNADGVLRPAMVLTHDGRLGIAKQTATSEYAPMTEFDNDGTTRLSALALKSQVVSGYNGEAIDVTNTSMLIISTVAGGATLGALTTTNPSEQLLIIKNNSAQVLTIPHSGSGVRTANGQSITLGAYKSVMLVKASSSVWDEIGYRI